jgi:DNA polymerase-3 subunit delta
VKIPASQLPSALKKTLLPCYLVTGDEPLLVLEALDVIRAQAAAGGFTSRELHVVMPGFDWETLAGAAGNLSLFDEKRILEIRLPGGKADRKGATALEKLATQAGPDLLVVVAAAKLDRGAQNAAWAKALESRGAVVQVWPVGLRELPAWIAERMRRLELRPDRDAVRLIADRVEGNLLAADQEIRKLGLLLGPGAVSAADVEAAVASSSRYDVFKLIDAAVGGDGARAVRILRGLRAEGLDAVPVVFMLARELRVLTRLAENVRAGRELGAALAKAGVWRNRQGLVRACVGRHSADDFYCLLKLAFAADAAAKGQSSRDPWQLATEIVLGLAVPGAKAA